MSQRLRILHCLRAPVGGLFRHVLDLASEQAERGHAVGIIADSTSFDGLTEQRFAAIAPRMALGITTLPMDRKPSIRDFGALKAVWDAAREFRVDVLHGHGAKGGVYARLARLALRASGQRVASFYTPHGGSLNYRPGSLEASIFITLERLLQSCTDGLIFESAYAANVYKARVGGGGVPQRIIPNGLKPSDFDRHVPKESAADFLFLGELREVKGADVLLRALQEVNTVRPATAVFVGSGPEAENLAGLAEQLGLSDKVSFPGAMPARDALPRGRIFVVPSLAESLPYVVLESAAAGMPLLSTNVGGIPEIVAGTDTALLPPGDAHALAESMLSALKAPVAILARAQRLKRAVAQRFTVEHMTDAIDSFYLSGLAAGGRPEFETQAAPQAAGRP